MKKYLPYILLIALVIVAITFIQNVSDTNSKLESEKAEMLEEIEGWKDLWNTAEVERIKLKEKVQIKEQLIQAYENENDSLIDVMRNGTRAERDSTGSALLGRLRVRHNVKTLNERGLRPTH